MLAQATVREGAEAVAASMNPMDLKRGVVRAVEAIIAELQARTGRITNQSETAQAGTISANGEADIGRMMSEAMQKVGNEGVITAEVEMKEREDRVDDALHATRAAVEARIVPGGGVALARAPTNREGVTSKNANQIFGIDIVRRAVPTPLRQIAGNAGEDGAVIIGKVMENGRYDFGFDAQAAEFNDMVAAGIIAPIKVVRTALQDAASIASLLITNEAMVAEKPEKALKPAGGGMGNMRYGFLILIVVGLAKGRAFGALPIVFGLRAKAILFTGKASGR